MSKRRKYIPNTKKKIIFKDPSFTEITLLFGDLEECKDGSNEYRRVLDNIVTRLYYIPSMLIQRYTWSVSSDDLLAIGLEELSRAIKRYDYKKNNNFRLYSYRAIKGKISREQKREIKWYEIQNLSCPIEECEGILVGEDDPEKGLIRKQNMQVFESILKTLPPRSKKVLSMYLGIEEEALSLREIADTLHICHETARKIRDDAVLRVKSDLHTFFNQGDLNESV